MNTVFHVQCEDGLVASVFFEQEPTDVFGHEPVVGTTVNLGHPFNDSDDPEAQTTFMVMEITSEEFQGKPALGFKLCLKPLLN